jgi:hypothetical protein
MKCGSAFLSPVLMAVLTVPVASCATEYGHTRFAWQAPASFADPMACTLSEPGQATLTVSVVSEAAPMAGMALVFTPAASDRRPVHGVSNRDGLFQTPLASGQWQVQGHLLGFAPVATTIHVPEAGTCSILIKLVAVSPPRDRIVT